jgi:Fe-S cluster assembly protein SufD
MQGVVDPFDLCTFFAEKNVSRRVILKKKDCFCFCFYVKRDGFLRLDFRGMGNQAVTFYLILNENADASIRVLYHGQGHSIFTCRSFQKHIGSNSRSSFEMKCACDCSVCVNYFGMISVPDDVAGVRAIQCSKYLVFSEDVCIHSEPAMDVRSKDCECSHGTAVSGIEPEVLHYFFLRGIEELVARELFISGFFR